ncbi:MAG: hypothetical protein Q8910_16165, partial [Bacteroidota bacterium]|nr:hypothetical protein [Bacteroidota bacterium]
VLGNEMKQEPTGVAAFIDLFNSKTPTNNPVANELGRLYGTGNDATPSAIGKNALKKYGVENMTPEQLDAVEKESGGLLSPTLQNLMNTPTYQSATDEEKAKAISSTVEAVRTKAKGNVVLGQTSTGTGGTGTGLSADTSKISKSANTQLDKLSFENSGKNYMEKDGMVYRRDAQGNITATPKVKFDYQVGQSQLTRYKNQNDMGNWMKVADTQLKSIQEQLKDPSIDPLDKIQLQNDADTLYTNMMKYKDYGGFSKPKSGSSKAKSLLSNDIKNSVTNSTLSDLHNLLAGTIGNKATAQRQLGQKVQLRKVKGA